MELTNPGRGIHRLEERERPQRLAKSGGDERNSRSPGGLMTLLRRRGPVSGERRRSLRALTAVESGGGRLPELKHISRGRKRKQMRRT